MCFFKIRFLLVHSGFAIISRFELHYYQQIGILLFLCFLEVNGKHAVFFSAVILLAATICVSLIPLLSVGLKTVVDLS